ncbi:MAG: hypothetical protein K6A65_05705 [Succinivibrionaceae bacterium]|nr:hypothetical protein [Succinivibrionaceae bacterium]
MTVDFNESALSKFEHLNLDNQNAIVTQGQDQQLQSTQNLGSNPLRWIRSDATQQANNAVRTELLKSLGEAFGIKQGIGQDGQGRTTFSKDFMNKLKSLLGADLKAADFGVDEATGLVSSGKPLTKRRIDAIMAQATAFKELSGESISQNLDAFQSKFKAMIKDLDSPGTKELISKLPVSDGQRQKLQEGLRSIQSCLNFASQGGASSLIAKDDQAMYNDPSLGNRFQVRDAETNKFVPLNKFGDINEQFMKQTGLTIKLGGNRGIDSFSYSYSESNYDHSDDGSIVSGMRNEIDKKVDQYTSGLLDTYMLSKQAGNLDRFLTLLAGAGDSIEERIGLINGFKEVEINSVGIKEFYKNNLGTALTAIINEARKDDPKAPWESIREKAYDQLRGKKAAIANLSKFGFTPVPVGGNAMVKVITMADIERLGSLIAYDFNNNNLGTAITDRLEALQRDHSGKLDPLTWEEARDFLHTKLKGEKLPICALDGGNFIPAYDEAGDLQVREASEQEIDTLGEQIFNHMNRDIIMAQIEEEREAREVISQISKDMDPILHPRN